MNGRQAAKRAAERIEELEYFNLRCTQDIKGYVACINHMIHGGSPCEFCEDMSECQLKAKDEGKGCDEWMLAFCLDDKEGGKEDEHDPVPGVQISGIEGS